MFWTFVSASVADGEVVEDQSAWTDPRVIMVSEVLLDDLGVADMELATLVTDQSPVRFVVVEATGTVESARIDGTGTEFRSSAGWRVTGAANLDLVLGPQATVIRQVVELAGGPSERYEDLAGEVDEDALQAALDALEHAGIDSYWWQCQVSCVSGYELPALAARDLLDRFPGWTQEAYRELTGPWRTVYGDRVSV